MSDKKDLKIVRDPEDVVAVETDEVDLNVFFQWDELSQRLASSGQMNPPWFRAVGLDDGELLLFSPVPTEVADGMDPEVHAGARWEIEGAQVAKIAGPTKGLIDKLLGAKSDEKAAVVATELIAECLIELPKEFRLHKPFSVAGVKVLNRGDSYPAPWKLLEDAPDGVNVDDMLHAYINDCLPKTVRDMVHTGALCMAIPETDFMVTSGAEKGSLSKATMVDNPKANAAGEERDFGEGFSGDSEKT